MNYPKALTISQLKEILEEAEKQIGGDSLVYFWDGNQESAACGNQNKQSIAHYIGGDSDVKTLGLRIFDVASIENLNDYWFNAVNT